MEIKDVMKYNKVQKQIKTSTLTKKCIKNKDVLQYKKKYKPINWNQ